MIKKLKMLGVAAAIALAPVAASAVTLNYYDTSGGGDVLVDSITDGGAGDLAAASNALVTTFSVGGYGLSIATSLTTGYPPLDTMNSTVNVGTGGNSTSGARVEISHFFSSAMPAGLLGAASATNNFSGFNGGVVTEVFLGTSLFDQGISLAQATGPAGQDSGLSLFDPAGYYITQIFSFGGAASSGHTANAEWVAPVPVPAAGFLLIGALGALGVARRRKKS